MPTILDTEFGRDIDEDGSRFWITDVVAEYRVYGSDTRGIVDENLGGIVAYVHKDNAEAFIVALRSVTGNV